MIRMVSALPWGAMRAQKTKLNVLSHIIINEKNN